MRNLSFPGMAKNTFPKCVIVVVVVCLSVFVRFLFFTTQLCRNFIVSTFISALGSDDNHHKKNRVVYIMTLQSQNLIILLGWLGLLSFLPDTTCMKRASSKSQRAHERYVDRCPVACSVCLSRFGSGITCAISSPVN